jgi:hypothetical protein
LTAPIVRICTSTGPPGSHPPAAQNGGSGASIA